MVNRHAILAGVHFFNGVTAVGGGLALIVGLIPEQPLWVNYTGFTNNYFPCVILLAIVGGSALIAGLAMVKHAVGWQLASIVAGMVMIMWIVGEIASIRAFHVLQAIYLVTGLGALWLTPRTTTPAQESSVLEAARL